MAATIQAKRCQCCSNLHRLSKSNQSLDREGARVESIAAHDLMPSPVIPQERRNLAMTCGDKDRFACASNILSQHSRFLLGRVEAKTIVENMRQLVSATWYDMNAVHPATPIKKLSQTPVY
jgi:hypothetical protein